MARLALSLARERLARRGHPPLLEEWVLEQGSLGGFCRDEAHCISAWA